LQKAIHIEPNEPNYYDNLGLLFMVQGKIQEAETAFKKVLSLDPNFTDAKKHLRKLHKQKHE
jgi:Tfp pilus assembly protein PilF